MVKLYLVWYEFRKCTMFSYFYYLMDRKFSITRDNGYSKYWSYAWNFIFIIFCISRQPFFMLTLCEPRNLDLLRSSMLKFLFRRLGTKVNNLENRKLLRRLGLIHISVYLGFLNRLKSLAHRRKKNYGLQNDNK